jgi:flagellar basal-body rod protein FlgC
MQAMDISLTALDVEWRRLEVIAANLANVNMTQGGAAARSNLASRLVSGPRSDFVTYLAQSEPASAPPSGPLVMAAAERSVPAASLELSALAGVSAYGIETAGAPAPAGQGGASGQAGTSGIGSYPAIDHAEQMTLLVKTARAYEANVVAMNTARQMYSKALELGRR